EFDPRTQRSIAPVVRTTLLPLSEWSVPAPENLVAQESSSWEAPTSFGSSIEPGPSALFELSESSLRPIVFLDELQKLREAAEQPRATATEIYERYGRANSPVPAYYFWTEEQLTAALGKTSQIHLEQLALTIGSNAQFELSSRPSPRFHGDVVACMGD